MNLAKLFVLIAGLFSVGCQQLSASYQHPTPISNKVFACDSITKIAPYTDELNFSSKYGKRDPKNNSGRDNLDKEWAEKYAQQTRDIRQFEKSLSKMSMAYASGSYSSSSIANCMLDTLSPWADSEALLGIATNHTGMSVRKWTLAAITSNYIALGDSMSIEDHRVIKVQEWIDALAMRTVLEWSNRPDRKVNNHDYWAAWAVMNSAIILDNQQYYNWAMNVYYRAMTQIDSQGLLANELKRNSRALTYHNYALLPLLMMADLAYANGDDVISPASSKINALVKTVVVGLNNPDDFIEATGLTNLPKQETRGLYTSHSLAWIPIYLKYHKRAELEPYLLDYTPFKSSRLGGDVSQQVEHSIY